jgi:uncharacterized protein (TIGR00251 family)
MEDIVSQILAKKCLNVIVKANSRKNALVKFDEVRDAFVIEIKAEAKDNKANIELIKFLSWLLKKRVEIVTGFKSKGKIIRIIS